VPLQRRSPLEQPVLWQQVLRERVLLPEVRQVRAQPARVQLVPVLRRAVAARARRAAEFVRAS
jgi:hypothetical protein